MEGLNRATEGPLEAASYDIWARGELGTEKLGTLDPVSFGIWLKSIQAIAAGVHDAPLVVYGYDGTNAPIGHMTWTNIKNNTHHYRR